MKELSSHSHIVPYSSSQIESTVSKLSYIIMA